MTISELETALGEAVERQKRAIKALASKHKGGETEEARAALEAVLAAERALAGAKGEQYAVPIDLPEWDVGAPMPHLLQNDYRTFLFFYLRETDLKSEGDSPLVRQPNRSESEGFAVFTFERCLCTKMGTPNDEVLHGHPLYGKGLAGYRAMVVHNSNWLKELEAINAVHDQYRPESWRELNHYILPFHDCTFECVARGVKAETHLKSFVELLAEICIRLNAT